MGGDAKSSRSPRTEARQLLAAGFDVFAARALGLRPGPRPPSFLLIMARLIMWNLVTLEGFFEGPKKWDLDWHEYVWGDELEQLSLEQGRSADALIFGRVTYEGMAAYWSTAKGATAEFMNRVPKVVFSRTLKSADWSNTRLVSENPPDEVTKLKRTLGRNLYVFGSAELSATLVRHDLFDEYRLCIVPVVLGAGTPLFKSSDQPKRMKLRESRTLKTGGVILYCEPERT